MAPEPRRRSGGRPFRRCAGCGRVAAKDELSRLALVPWRGLAGGEQRVVLDRAKLLPGRGAYLCCEHDGERPAGACLRAAIARGGLARALRSRAPVDPKLVESVDRGEETRS